MNRDGLQDSQLAKAIYVSESAINGYRRGVNEPGMQIFMLLCEYFDVSPYWLSGRERDS